MIITQNLPLMVQWPGEEKGPRYAGVLYGSIPGQRLIAGGFQDVAFSVGDELILRTVLENHVIGFWATVVEKIEVGGALYFLSYPEQVESVDLRKTNRLNVFVPVEIEVSTGEGESERLHILQGALVDLSGSGCRLAGKNDLRDVSRCKLTFTLPGSGQVYILDGKVVHGQGAGKAGVEFVRDGSNAPIVSEVKSWVASQLGLLGS